jgi:hypothetical protein
MDIFNQSCQCHYRRNSDESIRSLERIFQQTPTQENQLQLNIARMRAGLLPIPHVFRGSEGWDAQTILADGRIISSSTVYHIQSQSFDLAWWGIDHGTWVGSDVLGWSGEDQEIFDLGDHYYAYSTSPTQEEVVMAHQQVVAYMINRGYKMAMSERQYYRWEWPLEEDRDELRIRRASR